MMFPLITLIFNILDDPRGVQMRVVRVVNSDHASVGLKLDHEKLNLA